MYRLSGDVQSVRLVLACLLAGVGWMANSVALVAAPPTFSHLLPAGGQRGTKVLVTASGSFTWPVKVWSPGVPAIAAAEAGKLGITIPPDLAADRVWLRLYNAEGATAAVPFLIGNLPELMEHEPNNAQVSSKGDGDRLYAQRRTREWRRGQLQLRTASRPDARGRC